MLCFVESDWAPAVPCPGAAEQSAEERGCRLPGPHAALSGGRGGISKPLPVPVHRGAPNNTGFLVIL